MIAGIICGPFAGAMAGLIGGVYLLDTGGVMSLPFAFGTAATGIVAGCLMKYWKENITYSKAAVMVIIAEIVNFLVLPLIFGADLSFIAEHMRISFLPMLIANMTGVLIFVYLLKEGGHSFISRPNEKIAHNLTVIDQENNSSDITQKDNSKISAEDKR